jgi:4'-phosphopantetheinyl transferase EntD
LDPFHSALAQRARQALGADVAAAALPIAALPPAALSLDPWPEEASSVARAVPSRRQEFALGRHLARLALKRLGGPEVAIPMGPDRAPLWPAGFCGSISHAGGWVLVAMAKEPGVLALDIEPATPLEPQLLDSLFTAGEQQRLPPLAAALGMAEEPLLAAKACFSLKECFWKLVSAGAARLIDFTEVEVHHSASGLEVHALPTASLDERCRRWAIGLDLVSPDAPSPAPAQTWLLSSARLPFRPRRP